MDTKGRLVATRVTTLPPGTYTDPGQTGLQLRVRAKAGGFSRSWLLRFKFRGEESRIVLGHFPQTTLDAARGLARDYREKARQGIDPRRARPRRRQEVSPAPLSADLAGPNRHTIEHLVADYMDRHARVQHKRPEYVLDILKRDVLPVWKGRDARTVTPTEVIDLLDGVLDRGSKVMANRLASLLSQLFRWGIHRRIVEDSPVKLLYRPGGKEKPRERTLTDDELQTLFALEIDDERFQRLARVMRILLYTGQRRGELALARWSEIDLHKRTWTIPAENSKNGREHAVPFPAAVVEDFHWLKREAEKSKYVLPAEDRSKALDPKLLTRNLARWQNTLAKKGFAPFSLHDLRRTCRTGLARLKVAPHIAERVLNHTPERIVGTYDTHDYLEEKREALEKWEKHLHGLLP